MSARAVPHPAGGAPDRGTVVAVERREAKPHDADAAFPVTEGGEVVYDWDIASDVIRWAPNLAAVLGMADPEMADCAALGTGIGYAEHVATESPSSRYEAIVGSGGYDTGGGVAFRAVYGLLPTQRTNAAPVWVEDTGRWFADASDRPSRAHGIIRVITERYRAERLRISVSQRDPATGAFSRSHFIEHVARKLNLATRKASAFAIIVIGLETTGLETTGLEVAGDGTGRPDAERQGSDRSAGPALDDPLMAEVAARLRATMRGQECLARHAATKFSVLLENCVGDQVEAAARRLVGAVAAAPFGSTVLRASVGAVAAPTHGRTPQLLIQFAEEALEAARPTGSAFVRYDPDLTRSILRSARPHASDEILAALNEGRIALALQPIVHAKTRAIAFHEALLRLRRIDGTVMMPDAIVPTAEAKGLVPLLDRRVIDLAFWQLTAHRRMVLSINASVTSLGDPHWFEHLRASCKLRPDAARRLTVEITETCAIADIEATRTVLAAIKPLGVKIAIDDFGSGHSSFRALRQLPIDYLKIDGAFAQNLAHSPDDRFFIRTLIDLARNLAIPTVAEWVEDEATARILGDWGVDYLQGHLFGRAELAPDAATARR